MDTTWAILLLLGGLGLVRGLLSWLDPKLNKEDDWEKWGSTDPETLTGYCLN
jgi:hypothetical protein